MKSDYIVLFVAIALLFSICGAWVIKIDREKAAEAKFETICEFQKGEVIEGNDERICIKYLGDRRSMIVLMREAK